MMHISALFLLAASALQSVDPVVALGRRVETMRLCRDRCSDDCKTYTVPVGECFSPPRLFPGDPQWGDADVLDTCNATHLDRSFFASRDGSCQNRTGGFDGLPLHQCIGPFGTPRPWGEFSCG